MIDGSLQTAIYAALTASPALADGRVYDRVPGTPDFPYITIGDEQVLDNGNSCDDGWEIYSDIHVWSRPRAGSKLEAKTLVAAIVARLVDQTITVTGFRVVISQMERVEYMRDPDGLTEHGVLTVRHVLDPA